MAAMPRPTNCWLTAAEVSDTRRLSQNGGGSVEPRAGSRLGSSMAARSRGPVGVVGEQAVLLVGRRGHELVPQGHTLVAGRPAEDGERPVQRSGHQQRVDGRSRGGRPVEERLRLGPRLGRGIDLGSTPEALGHQRDATTAGQLDQEVAVVGVDALDRALRGVGDGPPAGAALGVGQRPHLVTAGQAARNRTVSHVEVGRGVRGGQPEGARVHGRRDHVGHGLDLGGGGLPLVGGVAHHPAADSRVAHVHPEVHTERARHARPGTPRRSRRTRPRGRGRRGPCPRHGRRPGRRSRGHRPGTAPPRSRSCRRRRW